MKIPSFKGIVSAAILACSPVLPLFPAMQQPAIAQSAQSVAPEFQGILPQLRQQTSVPILWKWCIICSGMAKTRSLCICTDRR